MRLSPKKIEKLAEAVYRGIEANPEVTVQEKPETIKMLIREVIAEDLKTEEEIEQAARKLLEEHMDQIQMRGASFDALLRKTKQRLAQERKFVL
jgi:hypothetical protein